MQSNFEPNSLKTNESDPNKVTHNFGARQIGRSRRKRLNRAYFFGRDSGGTMPFAR